MSNFKLSIDIDQLTAHLKEAKEEAQQALNEAVKSASAMTYAKAQELAAERLEQRLPNYRKALKYKELYQGLWVVELDESALWIEDGKKSGSMVDDLLRNNPRISKKGHRYKVIPFEQGNSARAGENKNLGNIVKLLKQELKARNIPNKKIENNPDGTPKLGKLHSFNVASPKPTAKASTDALYGVNIYQTKTSRGRIRRDIMTFRIVTDDHKREGKWMHPGLEGVKIFDDVYAWIEKEFETAILPDVLGRFG